MDIKDELLALGKSVEELKPYMTTEEATKNALIVPFIKILGYNNFDPREVRPEYICERSDTRKEKFDYAIFCEDKEVPAILIECKHWNEKLSKHIPQLLRYFQLSKAKFGLITNGINYMFYTDLEEGNVMDDIPFFEFNILDIKDNQIEQLKKFQKDTFNIAAIMSVAKDLKYLRIFKETIGVEFANPSENFVKHFLDKINYEGMKTKSVIDNFTPLLKKSLDNYITERVNNNLRRAMESENNAEYISENVINKGIITTDEEMEGYKIIKAILSMKIDANRIIYKDSKSYFAINYDNTLHPICRLYFNYDVKSIGLFNEGKINEKNGTKIDDKYEITSINDIYKYSQKLLDTIEMYDKGLFNKSVHFVPEVDDNN